MILFENVPSIFLGACIFVWTAFWGQFIGVFKSEIKKSPPPPCLDKKIQLGEIKYK